MLVTALSLSTLFSLALDLALAFALDLWPLPAETCAPQAAGGLENERKKSSPQRAALTIGDGIAAARLVAVYDNALAGGASLLRQGAVLTFVGFNVQV